jgi:hypothetical protein
MKDAAAKNLQKTIASSEPEFVNLLRSPGIDSQPGGPVRQHYLTYRPARLHRLAKLIPWNRFLDSLDVYKFGLWFCDRYKPPRTTLAWYAEHSWEFRYIC